MTTSLDMNTSNKSRTVSAEPMNIHINWTRSLSLSVLAVALSACQTIPAVDNDPIVARPNAPIADSDGYDIYDGQQVPTSFAAVRWQSFYSDPKLQKLIELGLKNNKDIKQTILAIQKAQAQYQIADSKDLPSVGANGGYNLSARNGVDKNPSDSYNINLGLAEYELDFWGKISSLKDQALQNYLATTAASDTAQVSLIANIAKSYVNLSYQMAQYELASKTYASRAESLRITKARLNAGIDSKVPSLQAEASMENARMSALNAQSAVVKAKNALQYLIGAPLTPDLMPAPAVPSIVASEAISAGLPSELLRYRPDVLQAEYQLKAAGANIDVARASYYPSISLTGSLGYSSTELSNLLKGSSSGWSFGPSVSVPIFDAGQLDANYKVAQIDREQALANYERTIETAFREVSDVLADRATLAARTDSQYRLQRSYDEIYNISEQRYIAQIDDYLSVLDAQRSLFATQQTILSLEQERLNNHIELYQVLGGGANLVEPIAIPTPNHTNLVDILTLSSDEQKAAEALKAASSATVISENTADDIEAQEPTTTTELTNIEEVDTDNDSDSDTDALIMDVEVTTLPDDPNAIPYAPDEVEYAPDAKPEE